MISWFRSAFETCVGVKEEILRLFFALPGIKRIFHYITPNQLCYLRMFAAPIIMFLFLKGEYRWAFALFVFAVLTDFIDGPLARWKNQVSEEGKNLDPMADKMLITIPLLLAGYTHFDNQTMTFFLVTTLLLVFTSNVLKPYLRNKFSIPLSTGANAFGQIKMMLESLTLGLMLSDPTNPTLLAVAEDLLWVCIVFGILSFLRHLARMDRPIEDPCKRIITIPNLVTLGGIFACIPAGFALVRHDFQAAFLLLLIIFVSDWIDGILARKLNQQTHFGAVIDPVRDHLVRFLSLVWFLLQVNDLFIRSLGLSTIALEIVIALINANTAKKCKTVALVTFWGKVRGFVQYSCFLVLLLSYGGLFTLSLRGNRILFGVIALSSLLALMSYVDQRRQLIATNQTTGQE